MKLIHIGTSPLTNRIFAGNVLNDGYTWAANKQDVTGVACGASPAPTGYTAGD